MVSPERKQKIDNVSGKTGSFLAAHPAFLSITGFMLAWGFLNILLNLSYPAPQQHLLLLLTVSPEVLFMLAALCAIAWLRVPFHWGICLSFTVCVLFCRLFRSADVLVPMYFYRPFNLYIDSQFLPVLIHLLYKTTPLQTFIAEILLSLLLLAAISIGIWWSIKIIHQSFVRLKNGRLILGPTIAVLAILLLFSNPASNSSSAIFNRGVSHRIAKEIDFILHVEGFRDQKLQIIKKTARRLEQTPSALDRLAGADVYLFFVESYGHTVFADDRHFQLIEKLLAESEKSLSALGFSVCSGFLKSPAFGGGSWLAHGTIASGIDLSNQLTYDLLITSDATTMAHLFSRAGYRTVSVMPANEWPWPLGKFFGYQKHYYAPDFDYKGPRFSWSPMPDQYVLQYIYRKEISVKTRPLFVEFVLSSSHAPFNRQPPYLEDWSQIGDGSAYNRLQAVSFPVDWPNMTDAAEAYITAIAYEIKVLKNFIEKYVKDDTLIIIMGDHQPNVQITGPQSPWSVPVHVISRNAAYLDPFKRKGYSAGLIPRQPPPHPGMETFLLDFVESFSKD